MIKRVDPFEEVLYEQVAAEIGAGKIKKGLWLKATVESGGNENKAKVLYTQFRLAQVLEEVARASEIEKQRQSVAEDIEWAPLFSKLRERHFAVEKKEFGAWVLFEPSGECRRFLSYTELAAYAKSILNGTA